MCESQAVSIKSLENQIGQIANALLNRPQGTLPSDAEANPSKKEVKEQVQAVQEITDQYPFCGGFRTDAELYQIHEGYLGN